MAGLALGMGMAACGPADPVAEIEARQAAGHFAPTIEPLRELLEERPDDTKLYFLYGRALASTRQTSLAEWPLRRAMEDPEWFLPAALQLAAGALRTQNYPTAVETASRILASEPENLDALQIRALAHAHSRRNPEAALADADRLLELDPDDLAAMEPRILALLALDRIDEAGQAIEELGERLEQAETPSASEAWHCATAALFADESNEKELAAERWASCVERYPDQPNVVSNAVEFYEARGELERARAILRRAVEEAPDSRNFRNWLAGRLRLAGMGAEAEAVLREATETEDPHRAAQAWLDLMQHYHQLEEYDAGLRAAERACAIARELGQPAPQLLLACADSLLLAGELDGAAAAADEIGVPAYRALILARVAQEREQPREALRLFEETFRLWPDNAFARYYGALAAEAVGDFDRAIESYRYSARLAVGDTDSRLRLARLLAADGDLVGALSALRAQSARFPLDLEGELLALRLEGELGRARPIGLALERFRRARPAQLASAVASAAEGVWMRSGPAIALEGVRNMQGLALKNPEHADALRIVVRLAHEADRADEARQDLEAGLAAHPDAAVLQEIRGLSLELGGNPAEAREAYARALELEPENARALGALGRLALKNDPEQALSLLDRAIAADPLEAGFRRDAAQALAALGRPGEAEARLDELLLLYPFDTQAAVALAELQLARNAPTEKTVERARRAVRFGRGVRELELLGRVHRARDEPELAAAAEARAHALQEVRPPGEEHLQAEPRG